MLKTAVSQAVNIFRRNRGFAQIGGLPNYCALSSTVITTSETPPLMGADRLRTPQPSERTRLNNMGTPFVMFEKTAQGVPTLGGLINVSKPGNGATYRARVSSAPITATDAPPSAITQQTNLMGNLVSLQDDPNQPDDAWITATDHAQDVELKLSFPPVARLVDGEDVQSFAVRVRKSRDTSSAPVICSLYLLEGGNVIDSLADVAVTAEGVLIEAEWDAIELTDKTGGSMELSIVGRSNGQDSVDVGAVRWSFEAHDPNVEFDTGWRDFPASSVDLIAADEDLGQFWGGSSADLVGFEPTRNLIINAEGVSPFANVLRIDFRLGPNVDYLDIGVGLWTPVFQPQRVNFTGGFEVEDPSQFRHTDGGQRYGAVLPRRRVYGVTFPTLQTAEMISLFDRLDWRVGKSTPVLLRLFPDASLLEAHTTVWTTVKTLGKVNLWEAYERHKKTYTFEEVR